MCYAYLCLFFCVERLWSPEGRWLFFPPFFGIWKVRLFSVSGLYTNTLCDIMLQSDEKRHQGIVDTPLIHSKDLQPLVRGWLSDIPAGRLAQATDLQAAVVYLASEASDYMTGASSNVSKCCLPHFFLPPVKF
uniref:Uncharacterized protein n=1 Tax=Strigops habroptila TaxID=2489341 RepID=A0A672UCL1_STRHB